MEKPPEPTPAENPADSVQDRLKVVKRPTKEEALKDNAADLEKLKKVKIPNRRVKMLMVNPTDFMFLFTKGLKWRKNTTIIAGVPDDARVIAVAADSMRNGIMLVVESAQYDEVPVNVLPPVEPVGIDVGVRNATKKKKQPRKKNKKK